MVLIPSIRFPKILVGAVIAISISGLSLPSCASNIKTTMQLEHQTITSGEPVVLQITISNTGVGPERLDLGVGRYANLSGSVLMPDGREKALASPPGKTSIRRSVIVLDAGAKFKEDILISEWVLLREPGDYTLNLELSVNSLQSNVSLEGRNSFQLRITKEDLQVLQSRCQELVTKISDAKSFEEQQGLANQLAAIHNDVAEPFKGDGARLQPLVASVLITSLQRDASAASVDALLFLISSSDINTSTTSYVKAALQALLFDNAVPSRRAIMERASSL